MCAQRRHRAAGRDVQKSGQPQEESGPLAFIVRDLRAGRARGRDVDASDGSSRADPPFVPADDPHAAPPFNGERAAGLPAMTCLPDAGNGLDPRRTLIRLPSRRIAIRKWAGEDESNRRVGLSGALHQVAMGHHAVTRREPRRHPPPSPGVSFPGVRSAGSARAARGR
jgi:hypothetical protein